MKLLAFDTTLAACSAAVLVAVAGERRLARVFEARERGHAESLMPMIERAMGDAGVDYGELDRIAVTTGPGTFTGCRVGVAAARGLALATGAPLVGATTLAVMARQATAALALGDRETLAVAVDARRGQFYVAVFTGGGAELSPPAVLTPDRAVEAVPDATRIVAGSGARALAEAAAGHGRRLEAALPDLQPDAAALAEMARDLPLARETVRPLYLRPPDAKPQAMPALGGPVGPA